jgi:hypothetical protein
MTSPTFQLARTLVLLALVAAVTASCGATGVPGSFAPQPEATAAPTSALTPSVPPIDQEATPAPIAEAPATAAPAPTTVSAPTTEPAATPAEPATLPKSSELLFLRNGVLTAQALSQAGEPGGAERQIVDGVRDFAATPDGSQIALIREVGRVTDLWLVGRDGQNLVRLTNDGNARVEATPTWAPDGLALVYAAADSSDPYPLQWPDWPSWCVASQLFALDLPTREVRPLGAGCDPRFSPDGRRIAFAAPPVQVEPALESFGPTVGNSIRLINRQGQNGWDFAKAEGLEAGELDGRLVYGPAWSTDAAQVLYHRFLGNQVEVDINIVEIGGSFEGDGQPTMEGAGWLLPAQFAPDGRAYAVTEHNFSDARGFGGYDAWSLSVVRMDGTRTVFLPSGEVTMLGALVGGEPLRRAQRAAWSPDGSLLAVQLPPNWQPGLSDAEPLDPSGEERPGEIWRWRPGTQPEERLAADVDFASPLAWLPPAPLVEATDSYRLVYPAGWQLAAPTEFEERTAVAPDGLRLASAAPFGALSQEELASQTAAGLFPAFVAAGGSDADPIPWPDGSVYRAFDGVDPEGRPVAGATRIVRLEDGSTVAVLYRTTPERWPVERAQAQMLLACSGPTP